MSIQAALRVKVEDLRKDVDDHEARMRVLEKHLARMTVVLAIAATVGSAVLTKLLATIL